MHLLNFYTCPNENFCTGISTLTVEITHERNNGHIQTL